MSTAARYQAGPSAKLIGYDEYDREAPLCCPVCGWEGATKSAGLALWRDVADVSCPRCDKMLLVVSYPVANVGDDGTSVSPAA